MYIFFPFRFIFLFSNNARGSGLVNTRIPTRYCELREYNYTPRVQFIQGAFVRVFGKDFRSTCPRKFNRGRYEGWNGVARIPSRN